MDASGNLTNKLFSMKLGYEDANYYDGNIGKQEWKSSLDGLTSRSFGFAIRTLTAEVLQTSKPSLSNRNR
jgi:hypothetical protein